jgi:hypothetical protein
MIQKHIFLFIFLTLSSVLQAQGIQVKINPDGSFKSITSTVQIELNEQSIKEALTVANISAKANLSRYISEDISSDESLSISSNQIEDIETFSTKIKSSSNMILKGFSTINKVIDKNNNYVAITISVSYKNMQLVNKAKHVFGKIKKPSFKPLEDHLKSLTMFDGVKIINFMDKRYIVSLATEKITGSTPRDTMQSLKLTKIIARSNLKGFIFGEIIDAKSTLTGETVTTYSKHNNKITEESDESLSENEKTHMEILAKDVFNTFWNIDNEKMFHYLYLEVPND